MSDDEIIEVVRAHKEGKQIQCRNLGNALNSEWHDVSEPNWNFLYNNFRVKPEPRKPREGWIFASRLYESREKLLSSNITDCSALIHVREVTD